MEFGPVPVAGAAGAILAHSQKTPDGRIRKGKLLTPEDVSALRRAGGRTSLHARH